MPCVLALSSQRDYVRVVCVHQGDRHGGNRRYHINIVDEKTRFEIVRTVEKVFERYLISVLALLLEQFPF